MEWAFISRLIFSFKAPFANEESIFVKKRRYENTSKQSSLNVFVKMSYYVFDEMICCQ